MARRSTFQTQEQINQHVKNEQDWESCQFCPREKFKQRQDFSRHLRDRHCTKEGGSFVCRYGFNGVCASLPLDGVNDRDYDAHVTKYHVNASHSQSSGGGGGGGPGSSDQAPQQWSPYLAAQNLPAVLNDPSRGKQTNFFTKKWGDAFVEKTPIHPSPYLDVIGWGEFEVYLKRIGRRYKRHQRMEQSLLERQQSLEQTTGSPTNSNNNNPVLIAAGYGESDIPNIFFKSQLALSEPETFSEVFPGMGDETASAQQQSGRLLQEKLSHYLDIVEVQIARQVSEKSSAFFHAMTSQDTIMEKMNEAALNVKVLRESIRHIDESMVKESLRVVQLQKKRENYRGVLEKLRLMATVHQTQPMIQLLLGTQDYVAALDLIGTAQEICAQELVGVHCFRNLPSQLLEMERLIDKMLTTDFEKYATADLNRPWTDGEGQQQLQRVQDEEKLVSIISGLLRKKNFGFVDAYKEEAVTTIKAMIKQLVIEVIAASDDEVCLTGHGEESQSNLSLSDWIALLEAATTTLSKLLSRIRAVHDVMSQINDASAGRVVNGLSFFDSESFLSEEDHKLVATRLKDLLQSVCNYCHDRCSKLVSAQSLERSTTATAEQIQRLSQIVNDFTGLCEGVCGGPITGVLKVAVTTQGVKFAQKFHGERKSKLALLLDTERWKQADVPSEFQRIIDCIAQGSFTGWGSGGKDKDKEGLVIPRIGELNGEPKKVPFANSTPASTVLIVDGEPFALVGAALILVQIVSEYCRCAAQLPLIAVQLSRNVVDLLRTFNSRCCQLVLGAGALHTAGLKTITSGNLALVSRALQLVMWLLPHVKKHFQGISTTTTGEGSSNVGALMGYETVERDFDSHIREIEGKVLSIVTSLVVTQMAGWDARPPVPSQPFRSISRHFVKLHEAIAPILPERQVHSVYRTVNVNFKDKLREQLLRHNIVNNGGPQHGVVTAELTFYLETLRTLKAMPVEELRDEQMEDIWLK